MSSPSDKDLVREFSITPDYALYDIYYNSGKFFLVMTYSKELKKYDQELDPKKKAQAWNYVKAMIAILRMRGLWDKKECRPLDTKVRVIQYPAPVKEESIECPKCQVELKLGELIRGCCPMGCGNVFKLLEVKEHEEARQAEILQVGVI